MLNCWPGYHFYSLVHVHMDHMQTICIWSIWRYCHHIISCFIQIQNGLPSWWRDVREKRPLIEYFWGRFCQKTRIFPFGRSGMQLRNVHYTATCLFNFLNKKHLKNVGPIRHNELPHANSPGVATVPSHAACASMSTTPTTTTTTRDRGDRYGPMEWAQNPLLPKSISHGN